MKTMKTEKKSKRQHLADERLSSGITIRQLFAAWGLPLDADGMLLPPREPARG